MCIRDSVNFEVQVKSMINMFWGEIEHRIIYKNPSYFMVEQQVVESLVSIKENLNLVDHQLHDLYKRYKRDDSSKPVSYTHLDVYKRQVLS